MKKKYVKIIKMFKVVLTFFLVILCFCYLYKNYTYASYESNIDTEINSNIAKWNVIVNDVDISSEEEKLILIKDINWEADHTDSTTVAPGSTGNFILDITSDGSDTAFRYDLEFEDRTVLDDYVLTVLSITSSDGNLIRTGKTTYSGIFSLDDIKKGDTKTITFNVSWINDDSKSELDSMLKDEDIDVLKLNMKAIQYNGGGIVEYSE